MTNDERAAFARDGFVVLRGANDARAVAAAREVIARGIDEDASVGMLPTFVQSSFLPSLRAHPALLALFEPARAPLAALFGVPSVAPATTAQIALRFPQAQRDAAPKHGFHLDGFPSEGNGVARGTLFRATALVGAYLTPVRGPDRGAFVAWPGSHVALARLLRALDAPSFLRLHGAEALLDHVRGVDAGPPHEVEVEPGDVLIAHHLLGHGAADNLSLRTREALYFRVLHPADHAGDPAPLMDPSRHFDGVRSMIAP